MKKPSLFREGFLQAAFKEKAVAAEAGKPPQVSPSAAETDAGRGPPRGIP